MAQVFNVQESEKTIFKKRLIPVSFGIMGISIENPAFSNKPFLYHGKNIIKLSFGF